MDQKTKTPPPPSLSSSKQRKLAEYNVFFRFLSFFHRRRRFLILPDSFFVFFCFFVFSVVPGSCIFAILFCFHSLYLCYDYWLINVFWWFFFNFFFVSTVLYVFESNFGSFWIGFVFFVPKWQKTKQKQRKEWKKNIMKKRIEEFGEFDLFVCLFVN